MGQDEVLKVLEENRGWMLVGEIMRITHESRVVTTNALKKLWKHGEIMKKESLVRVGRACLWKAKD